MTNKNEFSFVDELNLSGEERQMFKEAETICNMADLLPSDDKGMDDLIDRIDKTFADNASMEEIMAKMKEIAETDPKFFEQMVVFNTLMDQVEEVPQAETQKVSLDEINKEKSNAEIAELINKIKNKK